MIPNVFGMVLILSTFMSRISKGSDMTSTKRNLCIKLLIKKKSILILKYNKGIKNVTYDHTRAIKKTLKKGIDLNLNK
tara:strand:- start:108 stop:341 length:234 start_codon:yes stop_codon:yes gene_type:complete